MNYFWNRYSLIYRTCAIILIILYLITFAPLKDTLAFTASSPSYQLASGTLNEGGRGRLSSRTKLLLHCDGASGSTNFRDDMGHTVVAHGNAQIDTAQHKFAGASALFDGNGDYLSLDDSPDWNFGDGDFTIELWVRPHSVASGQRLVTQANTTGKANGFTLDITTDGLRFLVYKDNLGAIEINQDGLAMVADTWYHVAVVRYGNTWTIYQDGVSVASTSNNTTTVADYDGKLEIGYDNILTPNLYFNGWIDEVRISKGVARWTANFTPPAQPYGGNDSDNTDVITKLWQDTIGEPGIGKSQSTNYTLSSGFVPTIQSNPPVLTQDIPYQTWGMNTSKDNAFDLDDYFSSPDGYKLLYTVSPTSQIKVTIDSNTHMVSFSHPAGWHGVEKVYFYAIDLENRITKSNEVVLQVENQQGTDKPVILGVQLEPSIIKDGDLVKATVKAYDPDKDILTFSYSNLFTELKKWKEGEFWFSQATWKADFESKSYSTASFPIIKVTVTDPTGLSDTEDINLGNPAPPEPIPPIGTVSINSGAEYTNSYSVTLNLSAIDPDGSMAEGAEMKFSNNKIKWSDPEAYNSTKGWALAPLGDVTGDDKLTIFDAMFIAQYIVGSRQFTPEQMAVADVNGNHQIDIFDAMFIAQYIVGRRNTLPDVGSNRTVYVMFKDTTGNWSAVYSDNIMLDTAVPSTTASGIDDSWKNGQVIITLTVSDAGSGIDKTYYSIDGSTPKTIYTGPFTLSNEGVYTIKYYSIDKAGNAEPIQSARDQVKIDKAPPSGRITINNDAVGTNSPSVTLDLFAEDTGSGVGVGAQMKLSNDEITWSTQDYATSKSWELTPGDGIKTVYIRFKDVAGNWSGIFSDTIVLNTTPPEITKANPIDASTFYENTNVPISLVVNDGTPSLVEYQFSIDGVIKQAWSNQSSYAWAAVNGIHNIKLEVRGLGGENTRQVEICVFRKPIEPLN